MNTTLHRSCGRVHRACGASSSRPSNTANTHEASALGSRRCGHLHSTHNHRQRLQCSASGEQNGTSTSTVPRSSTPIRSGTPRRSSTPVRTSAAEALEVLRRAHQESASVMQQQRGSPSTGAPGMVDVRMYQQAVAARNRFSTKLSEAKAYSSYLEKRLEESNEQLTAAVSFINKVSMEFGATSRLAEGAMAAAQFGVDGADALKKMDQLMARLQLLEEAVLSQQDELMLAVPRKVPMVWQGVASEVKVMGDFDSWTYGQELSADDLSPDSVYSCFKAHLLLLPGTYRVKFLVDGEWRLAPDWPTETQEDGGENNLLVVD